MPKLNTTVKSVRIDNEKIGELEKKLSGQSINSWLNEAIDGYLDGGLPTNSRREEVKPNGSRVGLLYNIDISHLDDMATMADFMGGSVAEMIRLFDEAANEGVIAYDGERLCAAMPEEYDDFCLVCHDKGLNAEEMLRKAAKAIERGSL